MDQYIHFVRFAVTWHKAQKTGCIESGRQKVIPPNITSPKGLDNIFVSDEWLSYHKIFTMSRLS